MLPKDQLKGLTDEERFVTNVTPDQSVNWNVIRLMIEKYAARFPDEYIGCIEVVKLKTKELDNKFAQTSKDTAMRHMYELPPRLHMAIDGKYPKALKGENLKLFLKKFPQFKVAKEI